jgi:hypothetical protein
MITKGFILAKENSLIGAKILRDHDPASDNSKKRRQARPKTAYAAYSVSPINAAQRPA